MNLVKITDSSGLVHYVNPDYVSRVTYRPEEDEGPVTVVVWLGVGPVGQSVPIEFVTSDVDFLVARLATGIDVHEVRRAIH